MRVIAVLAGLWMAIAGAAGAEGERAGEFDYYVLALSWSPAFCAVEREAEQCGRGHGWILHGLWPQYERGWPSYCPTAARAPSRAETAAMADIAGSGGLAWHAWRKHGVCSGLSSTEYFEASRRAYEAVEKPGILREVDEAMRLPARVVEEAFLEADPELEADGITVVCRDGRISEVRICLTRDLEFRACGADVVRDCRAEDALFVPVD